MRGLEDIGKIIDALDATSPIRAEMAAIQAKNILQNTCIRKGLRINFRDCIHIQLTTRGFLVNTTTPSLASRLTQIKPTLERALFNAGVHVPIESIRAGKIQALPPQDPYPQDAPRIAPIGASEAVQANAEYAKDPEIKNALERLAQALARN
ncbi:MAG TPA: hypothetical protein IAC65_02230 [Candidatus Aphodousia faecipullorum]|nr:hypothetical protein [Candidatus Aphodousia faecipullorum]